MVRLIVYPSQEAAEEPEAPAAEAETPAEEAATPEAEEKA